MTEPAEAVFRRFAMWSGLAIVLAPVFISIPSFDILLLRLFDPRVPRASYDNAVSLLSLFIAGLGVILFVPFVKALRNRDPLVIAAVVVATYMIVLGGIGSWSDGGFYPLLAATQYAMPVSAIVIGFLHSERFRLNWPRILVLFIVANLLVPLVVFAVVALRFHHRFGFLDFLSITNRYLYAMYSHIPALVLFACVLALGFSGIRRLRYLAVLSAIAGSAALVATWSRAAALAAIVALLLYTVLVGTLFIKRRMSDLKIPLGASSALLAACLIAPQFGLIDHRRSLVVKNPGMPVIENAKSVTTPKLPIRDSAVKPAVRSEAGKPAAPAPKAARSAKESTASASSPPPPDPGKKSAKTAKVVNQARPAANPSNSLESSNAARVWYMQEGLRRWTQDPLFGIMFVPDDVNIIRGKIVHKKQVFQSHNQYVDVLLKTGAVGFLLLAVLYIWFVLRPLWRAFRTAGEYQHKLVFGVVLCVLTGVFVAANFQLYLTVWTTGVPLGFLLGATLARAKAITTSTPDAELGTQLD